MNKIKSLLAFAALLLCGGVWAVNAPIVVWDGDMKSAATKTGFDGQEYTLALNGNEYDGECIKIKSGNTVGAKITIPADKGVAYAVVVKYSGLSGSNISGRTAVASVKTSLSNVQNIGVAVSDSNLECVPYWKEGSTQTDYPYTSGSVPVLTNGSGYFQICFRSAKKWYTWAGNSMSDAGIENFNGTGLGFTANIEDIFIGGPAANSTTAAACVGLKIEAIALYKSISNDRVSISDTKYYVFPSDASTSVYAKVDSAAVNISDVSWKTALEGGEDASAPAIGTKAYIVASTDTTISFNNAFAASQLHISGGHKVTLAASTIPTIGTVTCDEDSTVKLTTGKAAGTEVWVSPIVSVKNLEINPTGNWFTFNGYEHDIENLKVHLTGNYFYPGTAARPVFEANHRPNLTLTRDGTDNDNRGMVLAENTKTYPFNVKNLTSESNVRVRSDTGDSRNNWVRWLDTLQTKETTFAGKFLNNDGRQSGLKVRGNAENKHKALTISNVDNASLGGLEILDYGKVVMTGNWAGPVTVDGTSILELNTSSTIASANLSSGATLKLGKTTSMISGDLTIANGVVLMLPAGTAEGDAVTLCGGTLTHPTSGVAKIYVGNTAYAATLTYNTTDKTVSYANARAAGTIYMKDGSGTFSTTSGGVVDTVLIDGDEVIVPSGVGSRWNVVFTNLGGHTVKVQETSSDPGISIKTAIPENTSIEIAKGSKVYFQGAQTINDGVVFSGAGTLDVGVVVTISGNVTIDSKAVVNSNGFKLAEGGSLKVKLADGINVGTVTSAVSGRNVFCSVADGYATYILSDEAPLATINGVGFASLSDAIDVAAANATITLCKDTTLEIGAAISKALTISATAAKTLTLVPGEGKKFVSAADIKNLTLGANVSLSYNWKPSGKVISLNFNPGAGSNAGAMPDNDMLVETMAGKVTNESWNNMADDTNDTAARAIAKVYLPGGSETGTTESLNGTKIIYSGRAYHSNNLTVNATVPYLKGYIDESTAKAVTLKLSGIPFRKYDIILYFQGDTSTHVFRAAYTKASDDGAAIWYNQLGETITDGTQESYTWGHSLQMTSSYANNVMRISNLSGSSIIVGSLKNGGSGNRGSIAAIQIVQMSTDEEDNAVASITVGETTNYYTSLSSAVSAATSGQTIKLVKSVLLDAATTIPTDVNLEILKDVELDVNGQTLNGSISGAGKIKYTDFGSVQSTVKTALQSDDWTGTLVIDGKSNKSNINSGTVDNSRGYRTTLNDYGNAGSKIELLNCTYDGNGNGNNYFGLTLDNEPTTVVQPELIITGELKLRNGFSQSDNSGNAAYKYRTEFRKLSGMGTILAPRSDLAPLLYFHDASEFRGSFNSSGYKFVIGERDAAADAYPAIGSVTIKSGKAMTLAKDANWTLSNGVTVDGALTFEAPDAAATKVYSLALKGTGTLVTKAVSESTQMKYILNNHANFRGSITTEVGAHVMLAPANTTTTDLGFSNCGFICVQSGSATLANGETWTGGLKDGNGGVYVAGGATFNAGAGTIVGKLYMVGNSTLNFTSYNRLTVDGNIEQANAMVNVIVPTTAEVSELPITLMTWTGSIASGMNFKLAPNAPYRLEVDTENKALKLVSPSFIGEETTEVNNQTTVGYTEVISGSTKILTGAGSATMGGLVLHNGGTLTYDPVRTPVKLDSVPTIESGATIRLASTWANHSDEYSTISCGKIRLFTYPNTGSAATTGYTIAGLKDGVEYTLEEEAVTDAELKQLVLYIGNYKTAATPIKLTQFGDSITEGIWREGYIGTPNYRIPLMHRLEAHGYAPTTGGFRGDNLKNSGVWGSSDANGVPADPKYRLHNGISAQRVYSGKTGSSLRAGFVEGVEAYLEASGDGQDVITLKIGTNDLLGGATGDSIFEGWLDIVKRLIACRPNARIVVTSVIHGIGSGNANLESTEATTYNSKIADAVANDETLKGHVFLIDARSAVSNASSSYLGDGVHPNWVGHNEMADAWYEGVTRAFAASTGKSYEPNVTIGAAANVPAAYRKGFVKLATMDLAQLKKDVTQWGTTPYTSVNSAMSDKTLSKIAYYVERSTTGSANTQAVWVDMDPWADTATLANMGVPTTGNGVNKVVNNLHIWSNSTAIDKVAPETTDVKGTLLFTIKGCGTGGGLSDAPVSQFGYDWNDTLGSANYGAMVVSRVYPDRPVESANKHRMALGQTLFCYNGFNNNIKNILGIGDFAVHCKQSLGNSDLGTYTLNWISSSDTFTAMHTDNLDHGVIEIWGVPAEYIVPDSDKGIEVTAVDADAAIAAAQIVPDTEADTAAGDAATRKSYLTITATPVTGEEGKFNVQAVVDNAKLPTKVEETAVSFAQTGLEAVAGATETTNVDIPAAKVVPGLYYSVSFGTTPDNHTQESERVLATGSEGVTIPVPALGNEKVYYIKVKASATK